MKERHRAYRNLLGWLVVILALLVTGACREEQFIHVGERWAALDRLQAPADAIAMKIQAPTKGSVGETVQLRITPQADGYLWVVQVDSEDQVALLFPNSEEPDNYVAADQERVIPGNDEYTLVLDRPTGTQLLAFFVTSQEDGLDQILSLEWRDEFGLDTERRNQAMGVRLDSDRRWGLEKQVMKVH